MSITDRLKKVATIPKEYLSETPPAPKSIKIELSPNCNYKCSYCSLPKRGKRLAPMTVEFFKEIATKAHEAGVEEFGLFYLGEPFTTPELLSDCVRFLKKELKVSYTFLTTNGSLAIPEAVRSVMDAGLDSLKFSVNFSDSQQFAEMTGLGASMFQRSVWNIAVAHSIRKMYGFGTKLYASSIAYNEDQFGLMEPLLKYSVRPFVDEHYWLPMLNTGIGNTGNYHAPVQPLPCWAVFTAAHVMVDGTMTACCHDATGKWGMGNISDGSFMEVWHSDKYKGLRKAHLSEDVSGTVCAKCIGD